jgi:hypothetical protein
MPSYTIKTNGCTWRINLKAVGSKFLNKDRAHDCMVYRAKSDCGQRVELLNYDGRQLLDPPFTRRQGIVVLQQGKAIAAAFADSDALEMATKRLNGQRWEELWKV